jgi:formylmethanofuran dehydrogenase subunit C
MKDIKELAKELGYEVVEDAVLLPLGEMHGWEYGLSIKGEKPRVYVKGGEIKYGKPLSCYAVHTLIKTLEFGEREFLIQREASKPKNKIVGLLYAFKNPKLQLDSSIKTEILRGATVIIPEGHEILEREIIELQEKISEAKEISSIPGYENILKNLNGELAGLADSYFSLDPEKIRIDEIIIEGCVEDVGRKMRGGKLVIKGDVGYAGYEMRGGTLVMYGDVGYAGGCTYGGNLIVKGNVEHAGYEMRGGMLVVNGDVKYAGWWMKGGTLVVNGDVDDAGLFMKGGRIAIYGTVDHIYDIHDEGGNIYIDFDKNPDHEIGDSIRPIEEFDGGF